MGSDSKTMKIKKTITGFMQTKRGKIIMGGVIIAIGMTVGILLASSYINGNNGTGVGKGVDNQKSASTQQTNGNHSISSTEESEDGENGNSLDKVNSESKEANIDTDNEKYAVEVSDENGEDAEKGEQEGKALESNGNNSEETENTESSVTVDTEESKASRIGIAIEQTLFEGNDMTSSLSGSILKQLQNEVQEMTRLSNSTINITSAVEKEEKAFISDRTDAPQGTPPDVEYEYDINGNVIASLSNQGKKEEEAEKETENNNNNNNNSNNTNGDSKEIFYDNGVAYVNVRDVDIDRNNKIYVSYRGYGYYIDASQYSKTPSKLQNKQAYDLVYVGTVGTKNGYKISYQNKVDNSIVAINLIKGVGDYKQYTIDGMD